MPAPQTFSKLLLDGGDPAESRRARELLGRLDGQTTNPSLIANNPGIRKRIERGERLTREEARDLYRETILEIAKVADGSVSIEVYSDETTSADELLRQGRDMFRWTPQAYVKYPTTAAGLEAAEKSVAEGIRVNLTLCFSQEQAAAVFSATAKTREPAFVSPFVGRLDDRGECGMDLIVNILRMFERSDGHVHCLTASVRHLDHLLYAIALRSPLITSPLKVYEEWAKAGFPMPDASYRYDPKELRPIPYRDIALGRPWREYDNRHELTEVGQRKFAESWNSMIAPEGAAKTSPGA